MSFYKSKEQKIRLQISQIEGLIAALRILLNDGHVLITVDFSEIHRYAQPNFEEFFPKKEIISDWWEEQLGLAYLFEEYPKPNQYLYLLPPYARELEHAIMNRFYWQFKTYHSFTDISLVERILCQIASNPKVTRILKKFNDKEDTQIPQAHLEAILEILEKYYIQFYVALTTGIRKSLYILESIKNNQYIKYIEDPEVELPKIDNVESLIKEAEGKWWPKIERSRPEQVKRLPNYNDAVALQYLVEYNNKLNREGSVLVLITSSGFSPAKYLKKWPKIPKANVIINTDNSKKEITIPLTFHPLSIFIYFSNRVDRDYEKTISELEIILKEQKDILSIYEKRHRRTDIDLKAIDFLDKMDNEIESLKNLETKIRTKDDKIDKLIDKIRLKTLDIRKELEGRIIDFLKIIKQPDRTFTEKFIEKTKQNISNNIKRLRDLVPLEIFGQNPARYTLSEDDFESDEIKMIIGNLRKMQDIQESMERLYELKRERDKSVINWEASLLIAQIKSKTKDYQWGLEDCEEGIREAPKKLKPLFSFLKNTILSHIKGGFKKALKESERLVSDHGEKNPRYKLQRGYFLLSGYEKRMLPNSVLIEAKQMNEEALRLSKTNIEKFKTCYRLALSNLIIYEALGSLSKAESYEKMLDDSLESEIDLEENAFFNYAKAFRRFENLKKNWEMDKSIDVHNELNKIKNKIRDINDIIDKRPIFPKTYIKKYDQLKKEIDIFGECANVFTRFGNLKRNWEIDKSIDVHNELKEIKDEIHLSYNDIELRAKKEGTFMGFYIKEYDQLKNDVHEYEESLIVH